MDTVELSNAQGRIFSPGWRAGAGGTRPAVSPADGHRLGDIGLAAEADVERAGLLARSAQPEWAQTSFEERAEVLRRAAEILLRSRDDVERVLQWESGSLPAKAHHEVTKVVDELRAAADLASHPQGEILPMENPTTLGLARRVPVGVVGVIAPWNAPFMLAMRSVAPALALGNAVIVKPDVKTALCGGAVIAEMFLKAGLPEGVLHMLPGGPETGDALVRSDHTDMISFTGSSVVGRHIGEIAGRMLKRTVLELGGNNAFIVMADADLDEAVRAGAQGTFRHQGQICMATGRHLVHESLADEYVRRLSALTVRHRVGVPSDDGVTLGPLISVEQAERVQTIVDAAVRDGADLITGGTHDGPYFRPTVLDGVSVDNTAFETEIFGPVAPVTRFATVDELLGLVQASPYGLTAAIHSRDVAAAIHLSGRIRAGMVAVNGQTIYDAAHIPMGGVGASGNGGRHGGHWNLDEFTSWQWVSVPTHSPVD